MTIKELYEWAKEIGSENEEIYVLGPSGCYTNQLDLDFFVSEGGIYL